MRSLYLVVGLIVVFSTSLTAQTDGDYRSRQTGNWNVATTWEVFNSGNWEALETGAAGPFQNVIPSSASGIITIMDLTTVTVPGGATITADQIEYENNFGGSTGILSVASTGTLRIANGTGDDVRLLNDFTTLALLEVSGTLELLNGAAIVDDDYGNLGIGPGPVTADTYKVLNGGVHVHTTGTGVTAIPAADWQDGSTCRVDASAAGVPSIDPTIQFYHFTWNGTAQAGVMNLAGSLRTVRRDFVVNTTNGQILQLATTQAYTLTVGNDFTIQGNSRVQFGATASPVQIDVTNNFNVTSTNNSTNTIQMNATGTSTTLNITGNLNKSNASIITLLAGTTGTTLINLRGDFALTSGTITKSATGAGTGTISFEGSSTRTFANSGTISNSVAFNVANGKVLDLGTSAITGTGTFTLRAGGTIRVGSADGLNQSATNLGNVRTSGVRTYFANSNIIYNGSVAQNLGDEWKAAPGAGALAGVAVNLEIANSSVGGVTNNVIGSTNVVGNLTLTQGILKIGNSNRLNVRSNFTSTAGMIGGDPTSDLSFTNSGVITGNLTFAPGFQNLDTLIIARAGDILLGSPLTLASTGLLQFGPGSGNLRINGQTLTINGDIEQTGPGAIASSVNTSNLVIGGSGALTILPLCTGCAFTNEFNNVTLSRSGAATYTWSSSANIHGILDLTSGAFTHSSGLNMATGSTFRRSAGTTYSGNTPTATTRYHVAYIGNLTTSAELPTTAQNRLENLTIAGNVSLDKNIFINGDLSITSGTFQAGAHNISMLGANFAINGGSFNINTANTVTFARAGTTVLSGSTIDNAQFGNFTINSGATVNAPAANINISNQWTNNGSFNPATGTVTFNGTTQNIDANGQPFFNVATSGGTKTLVSALDVNGQLTIESGSTLAASSFTINVAGVWDNAGTFNAGTGTVIFDGTTQSIDNAGQSFNNLTIATAASTKTLASALDVNGGLNINAGATLDVSNTNFAINVAGNFINSGTFNARAGTVFLDGAGIQNLSGSTNTTFNDITSTNPSTVTVASTQSIAGVLTLSAGTFNPNGNFVMLSSATGDARIAPLTGGATISATNMTVQRYLANDIAVVDYRYLASPVTNAFISGWKDDFPVTGNFNDPSTVAEWPQFPTMNVGNASIYRYNEAFPGSTTLDDRYQTYPLAGTSSTAAAIENGRGYAAFIRQNGPITIELVGRAQFGTVNIPITNTNQTANQAIDGWNLIGNPYASPVDWDNVTVPVDAVSIAVKDNTNEANLGAGQYVYYTQGGPAIPATYSGILASGQAFWVHKTTAGSGNVTFNEDDKIALANPTFLKDGVVDLLRIRIAGNGLKDGVPIPTQDELLIRFKENASDDARGEEDAFKLKNTYINFSSLSDDGKKLAINTFSPLECMKEIPLVLKDARVGTHTLTFTDFDSFSQGVDVRLLDNYTGNSFVAREGADTYTFQVTPDTTSFGGNRFKLFVGYMDLDLSLNVEADDICDGTDATVLIQNPEVGVKYRATLNGTTISDEIVSNGESELILSIPKANLPNAENNVVLMANNPAGCGATLPLDKTVNIQIKTIPTIGTVGEKSRCGEGSLTLTAEGAPSDGSYKWYLTEDATDPIAGETGSSFITPSLTKTKTFFVSAVNSLGCEGGKKAVTATVIHTHNIASVTGAAICPGDNSTVSATGAPDDGVYRWYLNETAAEPIPNQSTGTFETGTLQATTTYYVSVVNAGGCESGRVPVTVDVTTLADAEITIEGNTLTSNADLGNQWYLNGAAISGATGKTYTATESGNYKLVVSKGTCTSEAETSFSVTGDIDFAGAHGLMLYPNPSTGSIYIELRTTDPVSVSVQNQLGADITKTELKQEGEMRKGQLDITGHAKGMYLVVIKSGEKTAIRKIIKN